MKKGIPNLSTISTVIERACIELVKKSQFEYKSLDEKRSKQERSEFKAKSNFQVGLTSDIKGRLLEALEDVFKAKSYDYYKEKRSLV